MLLMGHPPGTSARDPGKGAGSPQAVRLEHDLHLSVSRSDALRRLLTLALEDAEDTAEAEAILPAHEPRVGWEVLKAGTANLEEPAGS
jgi:hypothetical protein